MADVVTPNLSLTEPQVGASADSWGDKLNANMGIIDGLFDASTGAATARTKLAALGVADHGLLPAATGGVAVGAGKLGDTQVASNTPFAASNGSASNITSISLNPGKYLINGYIGITPSGSAATSLSGGITTSSGTLPVGVQASFAYNSQTYPAGVFQQRTTGEYYLDCSVITTVYLVGQVSFGGTCTMMGGMRSIQI